MSDQQETTSDIGPQQHQQDQIQVEGMETMRVRVTNIIDGFFRFASRSASDLSASRGEMSESGLSSVASTRQQQSSSSATSSSPNNQLMAAASNASANTSKERSRPADTADANNKIRKSLQRRRSSAKKVKFKEDSDTNAAASTSMSSLFSTSFAVLNGVGGGVGMDESRRSPINDDSQRSGNDNMDVSAGSSASWNVHLLPERGEESGAEVRIRNSLSLSPPTSKTTTITHNNSTVGDDNNDDGSGRSGKGSARRLWFEKYMPNSINRLREFCGRIVLDDRFQVFMVILIMANALCMGLATFDFIDENPRIDRIFELIDYSFLVIFTVELALQFGYWGYQLFFDGWLLFDFVTIVSSWLLDGVQVFRSFRIFRAFRLVVRIPILKSLVYAVLHVMPRISSIMGLFSLIIYIFAVMTTTLFKDYYERGITDVNYFGRLDYSLFTLFQFVTLEGWSDIVRQIAAVDYFAYFIFGTFLTISAFILYSLVVAVVCDSFLMVESQIRKEIKDKARLEKERRKSLKQLKKMKSGRNVYDVKIEGIGNDDDDGEDISNPKTQTENSLRRDTGDASPNLYHSVARTPMPDASSRSNPFIRPGTPSPPPGQGKSLASSRSNTSSFKPKQPSSPAARKASLKEPEKQQNSLRKPPPNAKDKPRKNDNDRAQDQSDEEKLEEDDDYRLDPLNFTETTSPTATTTTRTLAFGELERKKHSRKKKKRTAKQRIRRVQMRLERLAKTQADILFRLDQMCKEVEEFNDGAERR